MASNKFQIGNRQSTMTLTGWEAVFFWVFAIAALMAALLTVMARNAVHCALFLISSLLSIAALYILLGAEFVAGAQIFVYIGGVMVLFLFVIMLVNVSKEEAGRAVIFNSQRQVVAATIFSLLLAFFFVFAINRGVEGLRRRDKDALETAYQRRAEQQGNMSVGATGTMLITKDTENVGGSLYRYASLPFEIASVLLLVAIVGSVILARTQKQEQEAETEIESNEQTSE
jgi:NADH-quinone oxidoreductase subunit J